ncbi:MAG: sigma-70 family RNA polymerase sigma factor [Deltaproteobacteria bacterium]|nr:sigma-70 family RNA polymerase sigma factor [Deltaproteobacteria bacterium]
MRAPWVGRCGVALRVGPYRSMAEEAPDVSERALLEAAQEGDRRAFGKLVRMHQRRVHACALKMLGDRGEAEDAVQETFVRAWRALGRFDGRSKLSTWLYRICVNVSLNVIRRRKRVSAADVDDPRIPEPEADPTQGVTDPERHAETVQLYGRLGEALDALSPSLRTAVVLVLLEGMPHKEAATVLGIPEGTVAWRIHEARRRMRIMLHDVIDPAEGGREAS